MRLDIKAKRKTQTAKTFKLTETNKFCNYDSMTQLSNDA